MITIVTQGPKDKIIFDKIRVVLLVIEVIFL